MSARSLCGGRGGREGWVFLGEGVVVEEEEEEEGEEQTLLVDEKSRWDGFVDFREPWRAFVNADMMVGGK